ncbi:hypothetical protein SAMN04490369_11064, partial [Vreelandella aquamarina]
TVWVNGDNGYIAMQVSGLEVLPGAGLTDSGIKATWRTFSLLKSCYQDACRLIC